MRSRFLLLFFAASLCAVEELDVKASFQEESATPFLRSVQGVFTAGHNGDKTSSVISGEALSPAGDLGAVPPKGSLGFLVTASSAAYILLTHFLGYKNNIMNAHARELSEVRGDLGSLRAGFTIRSSSLVAPENATAEVKEAAQAWREQVEEIKIKGTELHNTAYETLKKADDLTLSEEKDPQIKKLRIAMLHMTRAINSALKMKERLEKEMKTEIITEITEEIIGILKYMQNMRRFVVRIIKEKSVIAKLSIEAARNKLRNNDLVEAMKTLADTRTRQYEEIRHALSSEGEAVESWLEDAGYNYFWRVNPYYLYDKRVVEEKRELDNAQASFDASPPRAALTNAVNELVERARKLEALKPQEGELAKARALIKDARRYTKDSYSHTLNICKLVKGPLEQIRNNAGDLLDGAASELLKVYGAINAAEELLEILEDAEDLLRAGSDLLKAV